MIMCIKWQNLATPARSLAARLPASPPAYLPRHTTPKPTPTASARPGLATGGGNGTRARVALLCPFLSFSIKMDNFQPNKLSQRSIKIPYGIKPYNG